MAPFRLGITGEKEKHEKEKTRQSGEESIDLAQAEEFHSKIFRRRKEDEKQEVGIPFHTFAIIKYKSFAVCKITGIAEGDKGIVMCPSGVINEVCAKEKKKERDQDVFVSFHGTIIFCPGGKRGGFSPSSDFSFRLFFQRRVSPGGKKSQPQTSRLKKRARNSDKSAGRTSER